MRDPDPLDPPVPEPSPDSTLRLPAGTPTDPRSTQRLNPADRADAGGNLRLPLTALDDAPDRTQRLALPLVDGPPIRRQKVDQPAEAAGRTQDLPPALAARRSVRWLLPLAAGGALVLVLGAVLVFFRRPAPRPMPPATAASPVPAAPEAVPPAVQALVEQARAGDTHAMRTLGAYYTNGLMVPRDREKGIYWYRLAAEKGSEAARSELGQIEGGR